MDEYKSVQKYLKKKKSVKSNFSNRSFFLAFLNKILVSGLLLVSTLCMIKMYPDSKSVIEKYVYQDNISFAKINQLYQKYFGSIFPTDELFQESTKMVFNESLVYKGAEAYQDGVKLEVDNQYLVPVLDSGIIVFIGQKENYGNTIIIQQVNGIDLWYVGVDTSSHELYEYVEKGSLLGESLSTEIYLYYQKSGEFLDYQEYLP